MVFYESQHFGAGGYFKGWDQKNMNFPPHLHRCFEMIYVERGEIEITAGQKTYTLNTGKVLLVFPNQVHAYKTNVESCTYLAIFSPDFVSAFVREMDGCVSETPYIEVDAYISQTIARLKNTNDDAIRLKGLLYTICAEFLRLQKKTECENDDDLLLRTLAYVQENYTSDITLKALARHFGYDYYYLSKYLKKRIEVPFARFVGQHRVGHAQYLLQNTDASITDIAGRSGFSSLRNFNRVFAKETGVTPMKFRRGNIKKGNRREQDI